MGRWGHAGANVFTRLQNFFAKRKPARTFTLHDIAIEPTRPEPSAPGDAARTIFC